MVLSLLQNLLESHGYGQMMEVCGLVQKKQNIAKPSKCFVIGGSKRGENPFPDQQRQ